MSESISEVNADTVTPTQPLWKRLLRRCAWSTLLFLLFMKLLAPTLTARMLNGTVFSGPYDSPEAAEALHKTLFVADLHADSLLWDRDLLERGRYGHVDVPRMIEGRLALEAFTIVTKTPVFGSQQDNGVPPDVPIKALVMAQGWPRATWTSLKARALYQAERLHKLAARSQGRFRVIKSVKDLEAYVQAHGQDSNMAAGFLGVEGAHCLEGEIAAVDELFEAGVRMIAPVHFFDTKLGGSAHGDTQKGLTEFGKACLERMQERGICVDLAHASPKLIDDICALSKRPVVVSHTGVRGTHDSLRNIADAQLKAIAKTGGVVGIALFENATGGKDLAATVKAIRYTVELIGVDHVGLGSDFDGSVKVPIHAGGMKTITAALLADGFKEPELRKIMGANILRVLRQNLPKE